MNHRNARESLIGARNFPAAVLSQHRRGQSLTIAGANNRDSNSVVVSDEPHLDLFSRNRRSLSVTSSDESSDVKLGRLSVGSAKLSRSGIDDLLSSTDGGKHDYDWLLTPPGTPTMFPSSEGSEPQRTKVPPRGSSLARSASTTKSSSRLSVSHSENNHPTTRPARSNSVTRSSSNSTSMYSTYTSNRPSTILNTSSGSVSSYTRPSSPMTRSSSTARPSTPSSRPSLSRPSTPSRARPAPINSSADRARPGQTSRPSTPSSRPQIPANLTSPAARTISRPSTPTRRSSVPSLSPASSPSMSASRGVISNGRTSRPSSPSPRLRPLPQPVVPPDFPLDTPPNLRTTMPDRPVSAGRSRPSVSSSVTPKGHYEPTSVNNTARRHSSPIVSRGRVTAPEPTGRARIHGNGHVSDSEPRRGSSHGPDLSLRKPAKASPMVSADPTGFGRNISKKSLDMAIRHMDIRNGGNIRPLSGSTLFPQSIRSVAPKSHSVRSSNSLSPVNVNGGANLHSSYNGLIALENGNGNGTHRPVGLENGIDPERRSSAKLMSEVDIYESSRYDAILLKEDLKNTNWLHSIDDKSDPGLIFDHGFESLPEPFGLL